MDNPNLKKINLNAATVDALTLIPGIGPELAQRIIAARPFENLEELKQVSGIGATSLERILPYLTLTIEEEQAHAATNEQQVIGLDEDSVVEISQPIAQPAEEIPEPVIEVGSSEPAEEAIPFPEVIETAAQAEASEPEVQAEPEMKKEAQPVQPVPAVKTTPTGGENWISRNQVFGLMFIGFVLALLFSTLLSVGILAAVNRGQLQFATPAQINELSAQADRLNNRISSIEQDIQGISDRLDNMEMLGARISTIEKDTGKLASDFGELSASMESLSSKVNDLGDEVSSYGVQIETLQTQGKEFMGFLDGLRALLENLASPQEETK